MAAVAAAASGADGGKPKKKGVFKALKHELKRVKDRWGDQVKLFWTKPGPPWPVRITHTIPPPPKAQAYDVTRLKVRLLCQSPNGEVAVEVPQSELPARLREGIAQQVLEKWQNELEEESKLPEHLKSGWMVEQMLEWVESQFTSLLQLFPELLESYMGLNDAGVTIRRYALVEPSKADSNTDEDEEDEGAAEAAVPVELTEAQIVEKRLREEREAKRKRDADREFERKRVEAERKRAEAMRLRELGVDVSGPKRLSKKEEAARLAAKRSKGRQAKTGPRRKKYDGPGSAAEKAAKGKKKKKG